MSCDMASECNNASGEEGRLNLGQDLWRAALVTVRNAPQNKNPKIRNRTSAPAAAARA